MSTYIEGLEAAAAQLAGEAAALRAEGRGDEATLARIRINIHDICRTLYQVCARNAQGEAFRTMYLQKLDHLEQEWSAAKARAQEHDDGCRAAIEEIKLETLAANRQAFLERG